MDKELLEELKQKLLEEKTKLETLLEEITGVKEFNKDKVQVKWNDIGDKEEDNAVEVANFQDNISLERELETKLENVNNALKRMEKGTYGICEVSGNPIEEGRLRVNPSAVKCMKHAK